MNVTRLAAVLLATTAASSFDSGDSRDSRDSGDTILISLPPVVWGRVCGGGGTARVG